MASTGWVPVRDRGEAPTSEATWQSQGTSCTVVCVWLREHGHPQTLIWEAVESPVCFRECVLRKPWQGHNNDSHGRVCSAPLMLERFQ